MPKGTSIFNEMFKKFFDIGIPNLILEIMKSVEKPLSFKSLMALLELCKPCSEHIGVFDFDA